MKIDNRQSMLAIATAAIVVALAADRLVVSPLTRVWKSHRDRIVELRQDIKEGAVLVGRERNIRNRWDGMRTNTLASAYSVAENQVITSFQRWVEASRVTVTSFVPQQKQRDDAYATVECRADISGDASALTRFLYELERDPLAFRVESAEVVARDNNGQQLALGIQLSGLLLVPSKP